MPIQYEGIRQEHLAVRRNIGVFDVSHMGQIETRGPEALELLQHLISNDLRRIPRGSPIRPAVQRAGGVLDDCSPTAERMRVPDRHQRGQPRA